MPNVELNGIRFESFEPSEVPEELWVPLHEDVRTPAWTETFTNRTPTELETFLGTSASFREASIDPNVLVGKRFNDKQEYRRPRITIAFDGDMPVGYVKTADNVSGYTEESRAAKWETRLKRYRTGLELVVRPGYQGRGIALALGYSAFMTAEWGQVATAYTFPQEAPKADRYIRLLGSKLMGKGSYPYFGEDVDPVEQAGYKITPWLPSRLPITPARLVGYALLDSGFGLLQAVQLRKRLT